MYQKILVPLDGSAAGEEVISYAEEMAGRLGSEVILACITESPKEKYTRMWHSYLEKMEAATRKGARDFIPEGEKGKIKVRSTLLTGNAADNIVEYANKEDVGLILMSAQDQSGGDTHWKLGNVANKVLRATTRPVALIRIKDSPPDLRNVTRTVLVPLDGSKGAEQIIPYVEKFAARRPAQVVLLHVVESSYGEWSKDGFTVVDYESSRMESITTLIKAYLGTVEEQLMEKGLHVRSELRVGTAADEIIKAADEINATIVAMSTHARSGLTRWAFGSVPDQVLHGGHHPMLLVRYQVP